MHICAYIIRINIEYILYTKESNMRLWRRHMYIPFLMGIEVYLNMNMYQQLL